MKRFMWVFVAVCLAVVAVDDAEGQTGCFKCDYYDPFNPECVFSGNQQAGSAQCYIEPSSPSYPLAMRECRLGAENCVGYCPDDNQNFICDQNEENGCPPSICGSPIVIGDDANYKFTSTTDGVRFDVNKDGDAELTAWTKPGSGIAFLARDRNRDGRITSGAELFGDRTIDYIASGFTALSTLDSNQDHIIDEQDSPWGELLLWVDANHNGDSEPAELTRIADSDVEAISVVAHRTDRKDADGNHFRYRSVAWRGGHAVPIWDVFLRSEP